MALIRCPKCGGAVSSAADRCIHCGYRFIVCPECGGVCEEGAQTCAKCGYMFNLQTSPQIVIPVSRPEDPKKNADYFKLSEKVTADNTFQKKMKIGEQILDLISCIPLIVLIVALILWEQYDPTEQLLRYKSMRNLCGAMAAFSVLLGFSGFMVFDFLADGFVILRRSGWIAQNKVDYKAYLLSFRDGVVDQKSEEVYARIKTSAFYSEYPADRNRCILKTVISSLIGLVGLIFFAVFSMNFTQAWMNKSILDMPFDYGCLKGLIPCAVCFVLFLVNTIIFSCVENKHKKIWLQKNDLL